MKNEALNELFKTMTAGEVPDFWQVLTAISELTQNETLEHRPASSPSAPEICELNGHSCCGD